MWEEEKRRGKGMKHKKEEGERLEERNSFLIYLFAFFPLPSSHLIGPVGWRSFLLYDHRRRHPIKLSRILYWTMKHPLSVVLHSS